jgi:hypothetical protein
METSASFEARSAPLPYSTTVRQRSRTVSRSGSMAMGLYLEAAFESRARRMAEPRCAQLWPSTGQIIVALCSHAIALHDSPFDCSVSLLFLDS